MWHRLIQEDFVEGAMMDSLSPATRMGVIKPAARDRVVSAIQNAVHLLSPTIKTVAFELVDGKMFLCIIPIPTVWGDWRVLRKLAIRYASALEIRVAALY